MSNNAEMNNVPVIVPIFAGHACGKAGPIMETLTEFLSKIDAGKIELPEISDGSLPLEVFDYPSMWRIPMVNPKPITLPNEHGRFDRHKVYKCLETCSEYEFM